MFESFSQTPDYSLTTPSPAGSLLTFDQSEFLNVLNPNSIGMDNIGYLFVPDSCESGTKGYYATIQPLIFANLIAEHKATFS